ncbi:arylsulfatase [Coraliomargarita akajimensis]|uniref:Sulfatase n=1 Tax=Coraliomargarita akajimensis (strain DSM 45221 / IAM 15411 / JCM 23193 / KCTC 12865 / 04OKA010-24) TaxID=583355 RepID=D5EN92_CORAD|nr:arylsulfatase [Coraliomargarita akajimensis]ADE53527.1 sulfatase [Coraliomargarita akajimensis DSM 45221]
MSAVAQTSRPNVLLILTDDQGYGDFGCTGNPWLKTPNLDRLYEESVRLHDFHLDPMCAPSRAALLTGMYSAKAGVWSTLSGRYFLNRDLPTLGDHFRSGGYRTAMFGKWHMGDSARYLPQDRGFDESLYHGGGVIAEMPDHWGNDYFNATFMRNGEPERFEDQYCTDVWFDEAMDFIGKHQTASPEQPFFCYLATNAPHWPHDVHSKYSQPYRDLGLPEDRANYFGMIANLDENFGRMNAFLQAQGLAENTIVLYMGDNGTDMGASVDAAGHLVSGYNAGMRGKKCWAYDGGHRNLCMIRWPLGDLAEGSQRDVSRLTSHIDLMPTLLDLCGIAVEGGGSFDGWSLSGLLRGDESAYDAGRTLVVHNQQKDNPQKYKDYEVMTEDWRLAQSSEWGEGTLELTNAQQDPGQTRNLIDSELEVANELKAAYETWWAALSPSFDQVWPFYLGLDSKPVTMTAHAWHSLTACVGIYTQDHCRRGVVHNGYLLIQIERAGSYRFDLRRWPREVDQPICAGLPARTGVPYVSDWAEGTALPICRAQLLVENAAGDERIADLNRAVDEQMCAADFQLNLDCGLYRLVSVFTDKDGVERGAYYIEANYLG